MAIDGHTLERLRKGKLSIEARLDLHGMTLDAAFDALVHFVEDARAGSRRRLLVITGKGRDAPRAPGALREVLPRWLEAPALALYVQGWAEAAPVHGGGGAVYLLLRKRPTT